MDNRTIGKIRIKSLEDLLEQKRKVTYDIYEFDELSYTCLLCDIRTILRENQELKKQLEEYQLQNINLREDIMIQKIAFPNKLIKDKTFYNLYDMPTYEELLAQQKEFIKWLQDESKELIRDAGYHQRICLEILEKYKEIIGDKNE